MFPKLLGSYALSAITSRRCKERPVRISEAEAFLNELADAPTEAFQAVGLGTEVYLNDEQVVGCALLHEGQLIHLYAFRRPKRNRAYEPERDELEIHSPVDTNPLERFSHRQTTRPKPAVYSIGRIVRRRVPKPETSDVF